MKITIEYNRGTVKNMTTNSENTIKELAACFNKSYDVVKVLNALTTNRRFASKFGSVVHVVGNDDTNHLVVDLDERLFEMILKVAKKLLPITSMFRAGLQLVKNLVGDYRALGKEFSEQWSEKPEEGKFAVINFDICGHAARALLRLSKYGMRTAVRIEVRGNSKFIDAAHEVAVETMDRMMSEEFVYSYEEAMRIYEGNKEKSEG